MRRDFVEPALPGGLFFLEEEMPLEEFGPFLVGSLYAKPHEVFTGLRNAPCLLLRHILELLSKISEHASLRSL
jgi:hypothetical protein